MKIATRVVAAIAAAWFMVGCAQKSVSGRFPSKGGTVKYFGKTRAQALGVAHEYCFPERAVVLSEEEKRVRGSRQSTTYLNFRCAGGNRVAYN